MVAVSISLLLLIGTYLKCQTTCLELWINNFRKDPLDLLLWRATFCSFFENSYDPCNEQIRIIDVKDIANMSESSKKDIMLDNKTTFAVVFDSENSLQKHNSSKYHGFDQQIEHSTYYLDYLPPSYVSTKAKDILNNTFKQFRSCNDMKKREDILKTSLVVKKTPTLFYVHTIVSDYFIESNKNSVYFLLFARNDSEWAICKQALIFMAAVNFVPGTYGLSKTLSNKNLSIIEDPLRKIIYMTEDGNLFIEKWILLRCPLYFFYIFIVLTIWDFTGKTFEGHSFYRFTHSTFSTYICTPLLISTKSSLTDIFKTYLLERAWFRKIFLICSGYCTTTIMLVIFSESTHIIDSSQVLLFSSLINGAFFMLFLTECFLNFIYQRVNWLPEPLELFGSFLLISPMPLCLLYIFVIFSKFRYYHQTVYDRIVRPFAHPLVSLEYNTLIICVVHIILIFFALTYNFNKYIIAVMFLEFVRNICGIHLSNLLYWTLRTVLCFVYLSIICDIMSFFLQHFINLYYQYSELMFSFRSWIPLFFLFIFYLIDVFNEYNRVFTQCLQSVVRLIMSKECIKIKNIAILAGEGTNCRIDVKKHCLNVTSKTMLFYRYGVPHITQKFYYEIRDSLGEVIGNSLSIKVIIKKELVSMCFRMFLCFITVVVINTSNLASEKFEPVQTFLITSILFQAYGKVFLQRVSPTIDIVSNTYFKTKLQDLISQHTEEFIITHCSKRKVSTPVIHAVMIFITVIISICIAYIIFLSHSKNDPFQIFPPLVQFSHYLNFSRISYFILTLSFVIFVLHLVLISTSL